MDQGWAFYAWVIENDGWMQFGGVKRQGDGYIQQEVKRLLKQAGID